MSENTSGSFTGGGTGTGSDPGLTNNSAQSSGGGFPWAPVIAGGGIIANWLGGNATNDANSAEAAKNRDFAGNQAALGRDYDQAKTIWQSTHGYQNAMGDMAKAGLNPILAARNGPEMGQGGGGGGASAPGNAQMNNAVGQAISSGAQAAGIMNDIKTTNADVTVKAAQALSQTAQADMQRASARSIDQETGYEKMRGGKYKAEASRDKKGAVIDEGYLGAKKLMDLVGSGANIFSSAASGLGKMGSKLGMFGGKTHGYSETDMLKAAKGKGLLLP